LTVGNSQLFFVVTVTVEVKSKEGVTVTAEVWRAGCGLFFKTKTLVD